MGFSKESVFVFSQWKSLWLSYEVSLISVLLMVPSEFWNGFLLPKLFRPAVRKNCPNDREKLLKFEAEGREFAKMLRSLERFIQAVTGQNNFW